MQPKSLILFLLAVGFLAEGQASLPVTLLHAKKAYIDNRTYASVSDKAHAALRKWGQFELVNDGKAADIIFVFSLEEEPGEVLPTTGRGVPRTYMPHAGTTSMVVVDTTTHTTLYFRGAPMEGRNVSQRRS